PGICLAFFVVKCQIDTKNRFRFLFLSKLTRKYMHLSDQQPRGSFGSKFGVIAATAGSAVGLGNIWRFPYITGENGGGAFLLIYLFFVLLIGLPVMMSEL